MKLVIYYILNSRKNARAVGVYNGCQDSWFFRVSRVDQFLLLTVIKLFSIRKWVTYIPLVIFDRKNARALGIYNGCQDSCFLELATCISFCC